MEQEKYNKPKEIDLKLKSTKLASKLTYKPKRKINQASKGKMPLGGKLKSKGKLFGIK